MILTGNNWQCLLCLLSISLLVTVASGLCQSEETPRRRASFAESGGVYGGGNSDGVYGKLNAFKVSVDKDINARLRLGREKGLINVVQLQHDKRWSGDRKIALEKLREWLKRTDLSLIDVLHFSEEHTYDAAAWLDPLYDEVKAVDPSLPVYVWPSYTLGPLGKADGYVYDAYNAHYSSFRGTVMEFLGTGKPLIMCIDGSGYSDLQSDLSTAREQVMVCREFDIPVFYFLAESGSGGVSGWFERRTANLSSWRDFVFSAVEFQRRSRAPQSITAGDLIWGDPIELSADQHDKVDYTWSGMGQATVYGFSRLKIKDTALSLKGSQDAALDYQFWSLLPIRNARLVLQMDARTPDSIASGIRVERSRCGKPDEWKKIEGTYAGEELSYDLGKIGQEHRLRITLIGSNAAADRPALQGGRLTGTIAPPLDRTINLDTYYHGWYGGVRFRQEIGGGLWRLMGQVDDADALEPGLGLAMRGRSGTTVSATVIQRFRSTRPLKNVRVRLTGTYHSQLGSSFSLGVSLDGKNVLQEGIRAGEPAKSGSYQGATTIDLSEVAEFKDAHEFYVHMGQRNDSGRHGNVSSRLESLEIDALYAK